MLPSNANAMKTKRLFLKRGLDQLNAWSARNPGKSNEIAASVRAKAKEAQRFRCEVCDYNAATQSSLNDHFTSQGHLEAEAKGCKVLKPLSVAAMNRRGSRAAALVNRTHYCEPCANLAPTATI